VPFIIICLTLLMSPLSYAFFGLFSKTWEEKNLCHNISDSISRQICSGVKLAVHNKDCNYQSEKMTDFTNLICSQIKLGMKGNCLPIKGKIKFFDEICLGVDEIFNGENCDRFKIYPVAMNICKGFKAGLKGESCDQFKDKKMTFAPREFCEGFKQASAIKKLKYYTAWFNRPQAKVERTCASK
jgi:hypothetical protein